MADNHKKEQEAVFTTIVGGRPPGCGTSVGVIPRGLEVMVKKASIDPEFRKTFLEKRSDASSLIDLELDKSEKFIIDSIPEDQLSAIIEKTVVPHKHKSVFLGKVASLMLAAIGAVTLTGCDPPANQYSSLGVRPENVKNPDPEMVQEKEEPEENVNQTIIPPEKIPLTDGIRPDRPEGYSRGIRPDRPVKEK